MECAVTLSTSERIEMILRKHEYDHYHDYDDQYDQVSCLDWFIIFIMSCQRLATSNGFQINYDNIDGDNDYDLDDNHDNDFDDHENYYDDHDS